MIRRRLAALPIALQVGALALAAILTAQAISFGIFLFIPPAAPIDFSIERVARAISDGAGEGLDISFSSAPPWPEGHAPNPLERMIADGIAVALGVAPARVTVALDEQGFGVSRAFPGSAPVSAVQILPGGGAPLGPPTSASFTPFSAFVEQPGGGWIVARPTKPWLTPLQSRAALGLALSLLIVVPAIFILARQMTRPITAFAQNADTFGVNPMAPPMQPDGPAEIRSAMGVFNRMQERLRRHLTDRTEMVAAIAHDLRTPLTSLRIRAEEAPPEARDRMIADVERLDAMIGQVLAFVKGEQGREPLERVDLGELAAACVREVADAGADVSCRAAKNVCVMGEPINLRRAITNLIDNAVKYGGQADVKVTREGDRAILTVDDAGPGLPAGKAALMFEPFTRLEGSRSRETGGVGLGLALVRTVTLAHNGDVTLENLPEKGLRAKMVLPLG